MILFVREWGQPSGVDPARAAASLGLFAGHPADFWRDGADSFAELPAPRAKPRRGWRVDRSPAGWPCQIAGWIDNAAEICAALGLTASGPNNPTTAQLYGAAVERWAGDADSHLIGDYAAIVGLPDGTVRLSRSPWSAPSLVYADTGAALMVCSAARPLFAAGLAKKLKSAIVDTLLTLEMAGPREAFFEGVEAVEMGTVALAGCGSYQVVSRYDPGVIPHIRLPRDEDYVARAAELLGDSVRSALASARRPGVTLSGGLDSPLVAAEILHQLPAGARLRSYTFSPLPENDAPVAADKFSDDRPLVEAFAALYPQLDPCFTDNRGVDFDHRADQLALAGDAFFPARVLAAVHHGPLLAAAADGCDWLLDAGGGNRTYSSGAPWAAREFLLTGKWSEFLAICRDMPGDPRPLWQRAATTGVSALLGPERYRRLQETLKPRPTPSDVNPFLKAGGRLGRFRKHNEVRFHVARERNHTRAAYIADYYRSASMSLPPRGALEQVFGIRIRDITAYRPLIEFCLGIPTAQFVRGGVGRYLARRMAIGKLPEAQRTNTRYGLHNHDWHARLTPRLPELRRRIAAIGENPELAAALDVPAMLAAIDDWPAATPAGREIGATLRFHLPAMLSIARFVEFESGTNAG